MQIHQELQAADQHRPEENNPGFIKFSDISGAAAGGSDTPHIDGIGGNML